MTVAPTTRVGRVPSHGLAVELAKQLRRPRTLGAALALVAVAVGIGALVAGTKPGLPERIGDWGSVTPGTSGLSLPLVVVNSLTLFVFPLVVAVVAGETVAGEAGWGSLRYLLARPVARWRVLGAKALSAGGIVIALVVLATVASVVVGVAADGWHPVTVLDLQHSGPLQLVYATFSPWAALTHLALALAVVLISLGSVFAVSVLLSTLTRHAFSAVAGGIGFTLVSRAVDNIPGFRALGPWLPATDAGANAWVGLFDRPAELGALGHLIAVQAVYTVLALAAAVIIFSRSDVLS